VKEGKEKLLARNKEKGTLKSISSPKNDQEFVWAASTSRAEKRSKRKKNT